MMASSRLMIKLTENRFGIVRYSGGRGRWVSSRNWLGYSRLTGYISLQQLPFGLH
jgi:hypothetical protein